MLLPVFLVALILQLGESTHESRIVNGDVASPHSWPAQLSLQMDMSYHICGAVVLNENYALTAAHCVNDRYPSRYSVACGVHSLRKKNEENWQVSTARQIIVHPSYNPYSLANDIAIIRLSTPLRMTATCQKANLPQDNSYNYERVSSFITGWGRLSGSGSSATYLKQAPIPVLTQNSCKQHWGHYIRDSHICVHDSSLHYGACNGDSGGPLFSPDHRTNKMTVTGLTSFGAQGCDTRMASVYTRVSSFLGWISQNTP
ncbi:chymotrypsin-like protease CTRL-1 [Babylonia areolata]|uniref:chymotrypsin-like protease CTRL-1 n=1 Tax=Babylonia areolata TaxID=304850 RepID=UPI003FD4FF92